jgi:hypothetical protein
MATVCLALDERIGAESVGRDPERLVDGLIRNA